MVCLFVSTQEQSFCKVKQTATTMDLSPSSSLPSKTVVRVVPAYNRKCECECETDQEDDIKRKRRLQTLPQEEEQQQQQQHQQQHQQRPKKKQKRRVVSFDTRRNETISIQCHTDYSEEEHASYYFQKNDYAAIKQEIQRTIDFVKSPITCDEKTMEAAPASSSTSTNTSTAAWCSTEEFCVRGLESLVEDFVNEHKKRVKETSKFAVLRLQEKLKRDKKRRKTEERRNDDGDDDTNNDGHGHAVTLALAEIYKRATTDCEHIARRWGHFDAIDAGIHNPSPSFSTATIVSASASTATTDDEEESERTEDPIAKGKKGEPLSTNAFDSLTNVLLFHV